MSKAKQRLSSESTKAIRSDSTGLRRERIRTAAVIALLVVSTLAVYWRVLGHGFILYDDPCYVTENPHVKAGLSAKGIAWAFTTNYYGNWHPLTWLSLMLDHQVYGLNPLGFHLTNLLLHIANALLLFWVLRRMTGSLWRSAFAAALFALHPLHVESVAWITERKDVLSTLFWLLTMWAYIRYTERPRLGRYILVPLFLAIGLMAKPMLVSLPIVLILMDWWPLRRFPQVGWKRLLLEKAPLFMLSAASCIVTMWAQHDGISSLDALPFLVRAQNALVSYAAYIVKSVWPSGLACIYLYNKSIPAWQTLGALILVTTVSALAFRHRKSHPYIAVGWIWYLITLVPVIGLVQVGSQSMADRYTYIPLIGLSLMLAWGVPALVPRSLARWTACAAAVVVAALGLCTMHQVRYWNDDLALFQHTLDVTGDNWVAHNAMGIYLSTQGDFPTAIEHYEAALKTNPGNVNINNNMGLALAQTGEVDRALQYYDRAITINPKDPKAHTNKGIALVNMGRLGAAISELGTAVEIDPGMVTARGQLAGALMNNGQLDKAVDEYRIALGYDPNDADLHCNLAVALSSQGKSSEAESEFSEAVRLNPDNAQIRTNFAILLVQSGKAEQAIGQLESAVRIRPGLPNAYAVLASAYYQTGRYADAWTQVHLCRKYGGYLDQGFLRMLSSNMPDPGQQ